MKPYRVIKFENKKEWEFYLKKVDSSILENSHNFLNIFKNYFKDTEPEIFYFEKNNSKYIYVYLKSKVLIGDYYHVHSPYCYGGFLTNDDSEVFFSLFRKNFVEYCNENKIVTEYVRLNPITFKEKKFYKNYFDYFKLHSQTLYIDLKNGYNAPFRESFRRKVKKASQNKNLSFTFNDQENFKNFFDMYNLNMEVKNVNNFLKFDKYFFENIDKYVKKDFYYPTIRLHDKIIAGAIFMKNNNFLDLYLAASYPEAKENNGCNHMLFHNFFRKVYSNKNDIKSIHLGGGSDTLRFFKSGFAPEKNDYFIIKNIINKELYEKILKININKINYDDFFPDKRFYNFSLLYG